MSDEYEDDDSYYGSPRRERDGLPQFTMDPRWRSSTVIDMCRAMRETNTYSERLPILADALMDAGADDDTLLNACRVTGEMAYAQRLVAMIESDELDASVKWLEAFAGRWNFGWQRMIDDSQNEDGYVVAGGIDLHGSRDLGAGVEERFWECIEAITGKEFSERHREGFTWSCSC